MSSATVVPETRDLTGDDARRTLRDCGRRKLIGDAFVRLRVADGFSHARSLAYTTSLLLVQAIIAIVGVAVAFGSGGVSHVIVRTLHAAVPGPGGDLLTRTVAQANAAGATHRYGGLAFGLVGSLVTASTTLAQIERAFNRLYGVEQDRPTLRKYGLATVLAVTAGVFICIAFAALALGESIGTSLHNREANDAWAVARWPVSFALITVAVMLLLRHSPRRRQPRLSWLAFGATVSALLWVVVTVALGVFFSLSSSFGDTYGPLAGVVALLIWSFLAAVAVLLGAAMAAELEAVRAGVAQPQDPKKVEHSEPRRARPLDAARAS